MALPTPYRLTRNSGGYSFTTGGGTSYQIVFTDFGDALQPGSFLHGHLFDFSFYPLTILAGRKSADQRVMATVMEVATRFFAQNPAGLLLVTYDSTDQRHVARERLFENLYAKYLPEIQQAEGFAIGYFDFELNTGEPVPKKYRLYLREDHPDRLAVTLELKALAIEFNGMK